jgi:prolyl 4-hydroxylase
MFERIISDPNITNKYPLTILSRPSSEDEEEDDEENDEESGGPWVILLDNFINDTEAQRLIELGATVGYKRSKDLGIKSEETGEYNSKVSERRTSMNAWCNTDECENDPITITFFDRIEQLTNIPMINSEAIQLLRYEYGQFYLPHHDYIADDYDRIQGVRMLTVYLYLNNVTQGGGTNFPELDLTVQPIQGRALIWPSVYNDRPHIKDPRTRHQALPVDGINEIKYGANIWIHQREYHSDC